MSDSSSSILELHKIKCSREKGVILFSDVNITVSEGDIIVLQGRSGSGKSTLLKCIAQLVLHEGETRYRGSTPQAFGIPSYRTRVMYVPQRPALLPGSPSDFVKAIMDLHSHKDLLKNSIEESTQEVLKRCFQTSQTWGIDPELWDRDWHNLSGGEGQRILLSIGVSLNGPEILLLDEPTSALDSETSLVVENFLLDMVRSHKTSLKALVWITHSPEQSHRVGNRFIYLFAGGCHESDDGTASSPYPVTPTPAG